MTLYCYGDSNTFGYDPRNFFDGRYDHPWTDILGDLTGWSVRNNGMNGRAVPKSAVAFPKNADLILVMLGTNDLLQGASAVETAARMERFLLRLDRSKLVLLAPPPFALGEWVPSLSLIDASRELAIRYDELSRHIGVRFLNTGNWNIPLAYDGVHFTEEGHRIFAQQLAKECMILCSQRQDMTPIKGGV